MLKHEEYFNSLKYATFALFLDVCEALLKQIKYQERNIKFMLKVAVTT
jgi:hypothetical protein